MTSENFDNHTIFDRLNSLKEILENEEVKEKIDLEKLSYFQTVFSYINQRVKLTIPDLIQQTELDSLSTELDAGISQINSFLGNTNAGHLTNATNNFIAAINRIKNFPIPVAKADFNFSRKIAEFEKIAKSKYKSLEKEKDELQAELTNFKTDLTTKETEIQRLIKLIEGKETEIQNLNSTFQTDFNNIKSEHNQNFENDKKTYRAEIDKSKEQFKKEIDELKNSIDTDTSTLISKLETKLSEAKKLVNLIGNVGITGNYQNIANSHKKSANFWRVTAIVFMSIFSILLVWTIIDLSSEGFNWTKSLIRLIAAAALSYPATYAARESSKHRKLETINRNAELELASINPFIEGLSDDKKQIIKEKLVEKYFGNNRNNDFLDTKEEGLSIPAFEKILSAISKLKG
ncbi:OmpH family outer membrane protein [Aequorivita sp. F47161]|uniref:OmpH family outer membrane protein n=1 Tax=Aequorivita vitellina TaxID=2874475 RepID=A0A9X1U1X4_9FLAO|nr:OmpH family outer membrane protein [Aequorivita vitellina]MCG2420094.1 OmpH family outer membrane protein [Aequorivita vitellina]